MTYTFTTDFGNGVILAPCLQVLCSEIARKYPDAVNLGEIGDSSHQGEGYGSDHNPFITHNGKRYVRAIDIGGPQAIQQALFNFIQAKYAAHDSRVWPYGYVHKDGVITTWFSTGTHNDPGDYGHLHISVTQANGRHPSPSGWVPALDSRAAWGLAIAPTPTKDWFDMATKTDLDDVVKAHTDPLHDDIVVLMHGKKDPKGNETHLNNMDSFGARLTAIEAKLGI